MKNKLKRLIPGSVKAMLKQQRSTANRSSTQVLSGDVLNGTVAYNQYGGYFVPMSAKQRPAVQKVLNGDVYEPDTITFMRNHCKGGDIIHAGTFFGDFLHALSSGMSQNAKVWAFEPNVENFRCAQLTLQINNLKNVELRNSGLGDVNEKSQMLVESGSGESLGGGSMILKEKPLDGKTMEISIQRIDDIIPEDRKVSIVQLDVEGYEKEALIGGLNTIRRWKPILILEDNNHIIGSDWFNENIQSLGYQVNRKIHGNTLLTIPSIHQI